MIGAVRTHAKSRGPLLGAVALVALAAGLRSAAPPERTIEGVAAGLGRAAGGTVRPDDFLWEPRGGFIHDAFVGRRVLFLASRAADGKDGPRDLYRTRVRLTRAGRPIVIDEPLNLTRTPLGDDRDLTGSGHRVAFTTVTPEGVQGVTLIDLDGATERPPTWGARLLRALDRLATTGEMKGLARTEIAFGQPPTEARLEVAPSALVMSLGGEGIPAALDFATGTLQIGREGAFDATVAAVPELPRPAGAVLADLASEEIGVASASLVRALFEGAPRLPSRRESAAPPEGLRIAADYPVEGGWPPSPIAPPNAKPFDGEGLWHVAPSMQGPAQQVAAPPIVEAMLRPDPDDPDALVRLIAIDTRRLDLKLIPGAAVPAPEAGPHGAGTLPRGADAKRIVAALAAGPAKASRPIGFFGQGRLFAPLVDGAPALAVRQDGHAAVGAWSEATIRDAFSSVMQGPDLARGAPFALADSGSRTARAAMCRTKDGYLVYGFAASAKASTLDAGLKLAGCVASLVVSHEPERVGFAYVKPSVAEDGGTSFNGALASPVMSLRADALGDVQLETTAILIARDPQPAAFTTKKIAWADDGGKQPPPAWIPGVVSFEAEELGAKVKVTAFLPGRVTFRIATGADEGISGRGDRPGPSTEERAAAIASLGLSVAKRTSRRGLVVKGVEVVRPAKSGVWLVFEGGRVSFARVGDPLPAGADATELPLTANDHKLLPAAREVGQQRPRTALCALPDGTVVIAHTSFDTDEATTEVLLDVGCERVITLDRGAHDGVFVRRAGTDQPVEPASESTAIYILPAAGTGTATDLR